MPDKYQSLAELKLALQNEHDYRVKLIDRRSRATVISPHGGFIEAGTSALSQALAGSKYNHYDFQGLRSQNAEELHVTSTRFRDPDLSKVLARSCLAVSFHCMGNQKDSVIWLGGRNKKLKQSMLESLLQRGFSVNPDSPLYRGESPQNVVNLACQKGVQLELSKELISELFDSNELFNPCGKAPGKTAKFDWLIEAIENSLSTHGAFENCSCANVA